MPRPWCYAFSPRSTRFAPSTNTWPAQNWATCLPATLVSASCNNIFKNASPRSVKIVPRSTVVPITNVFTSAKGIFPVDADVTSPSLGGSSHSASIRTSTSAGFRLRPSLQSFLDIMSLFRRSILFLREGFLYACWAFVGTSIFQIVQESTCILIAALDVLISVGHHSVSFRVQ